MALVGKSASQRNFCKAELRASQERLSAADAKPADILADCAAETAVKLPADLDGVTAGGAPEFGESETAGAFLMEHLADSAEPLGKELPRPGEFA
jgi:hypothetical protein